MIVEHKDLLRNWLRGKNYHPHDISTALSWYDHQVYLGNKPTDAQVLQVADKCHCVAIKFAEQNMAKGQPVIVSINQPEPPTDILEDKTLRDEEETFWDKVLSGLGVIIAALLIAIYFMIFGIE